MISCGAAASTSVAAVRPRSGISFKKKFTTTAALRIIAPMKKMNSMP